MKSTKVEVGLKLVCGDQEFKLEKDKMTLGRDKNCDIAIQNSYVSPIHCFIIVDSSGVINIQDFNSKNGVYVNNNKIHQTTLGVGDELKIAGLNFTLEEDVDIKELSQLDQGTEAYVATDVDYVEVINVEEELPLLPGQEYIDGELCDLNLDIPGPQIDTFSELSLKTINWGEGVEETEIDEEKHIEAIHYEQNEDLYLEVTHIHGIDVLDVEYIKISDKGVHLGNKTSRDTIEVLSEGLFAQNLIYFNNQLVVNIPESVTAFDLETRTPLIGEHKIERGQSVTLVNGVFQLHLRVTDAPPKFARAPFFRSDRELNKQITGFIGAGLAFLFILTFFLPQIEEKKKEVTIVYKIPKPFENAEKIKTDKIAEVKNDNDKNRSKEKQVNKNEKKSSEKVAQKKSNTNKNVAKTNPQKEQPKANIKTPQKTVAKVDTYKLDVSNKLNNLFAKTGSLNNIKVKRNTASVESQTSVDVNATEKIATATRAGKVAKLGTGGVAQGIGSSGAKGLVDSEGVFSSFIKSKTVVLGSMDPELLRKILRQYLPQFRHCYQQELEFNSDDLQGIVDLNFRINQNGKISQVNVKAKKSDFSSKGTNCMASVLRIIQFPRPKGGGVVDVRQPLNFYSEKT